jgi:hypothetical protein
VQPLARRLIASLVTGPFFYVPVPKKASGHLVVDLCCGTGGWTDAFLAQGCTVVGYDVRGDLRYRGHRILADVRELDGRRFRDALVIVASPPCDGFSLANPIRRQPDYHPDMSVVDACFRIAQEAGRPLILENVYGAVKFFVAQYGPPAHHFGKFYLWGSGVPVLLPAGPRWKDKDKMRHRSRHLRARIPGDLANAIAQYWCSDPNRPFGELDAPRAPRIGEGERRVPCSL